MRRLLYFSLLEAELERAQRLGATVIEFVPSLYWEVINVYMSYEE